MTYPRASITQLAYTVNHIAGSPAGVAGFTSGAALSALMTPMAGGPSVGGAGGVCLSPDKNTLYFMDSNANGCIRALTHLREPDLSELTDPIATDLNAYGLINTQLGLGPVSGVFYVAGQGVFQVGGGQVTPSVGGGVRGFCFTNTEDIYWGWSTDPWGWNTPGLGKNGTTQIVNMDYVLYLLGARRLCFGPNSEFTGAVCGLHWEPPNTIYWSHNGGYDAYNDNWIYLNRMNMDNPYSDLGIVTGLGWDGLGGTGYGGIQACDALTQPPDRFLVCGGQTADYYDYGDNPNMTIFSITTGETLTIHDGGNGGGFGGFGSTGANSRVYVMRNNGIYEILFTGWTVGSVPMVGQVRW